MAVKLNPPALLHASYSKQFPSCRKTQYHILPFKSQWMCKTTQLQTFCTVNMTSGQSDESGKLKFDRIIDKAKQLWDCSPRPVKRFPWNRSLENFIQLILDLILAVIKYLSVPVFAVTCISEMSYCAHERKLYYMPIPFLVGGAVTGVLRAAAEEVFPSLKNVAVPWHLVAIAIFFTLLKLPGPYYPYWGRIFIPHFANGALLRTLWFAFLWYSRPQKLSQTTVGRSTAKTTQS